MFYAWRVGHSVTLDDDVEIEFLPSKLIIGHIDDTDMCFYSDSFQISDIGVDDPLEGRFEQQELDGQLFALGVNPLVVLDGPAGGAQKFGGFPKITAVIARSVGHW